MPAEPGPEDLKRENTYLRQRNAHLQAEVSDLSAENGRLQQMLERLHARRAPAPPSPLGGGQGA